MIGSLRNRQPARGIASRMNPTRASIGSVPPTGERAKPRQDDATQADQLEGTSSASLLFRPTAVNVKLIYASFLASLAILPLAPVGAFYAHQCAKQNPPQWLATHYLYQKRTFWIGLFANLIAWAVSFTGAGLLLFPLIAIWVVARSVKGLIRVAQHAEIEEPLSYFV